MKNNSSMSMQSFWMFFFGLVLGVLLVLAVMFAQGSGNNGATNLFRWNYNPYPVTNLYPGKSLNAPLGKATSNLRSLDVAGPISGITPSL